MKKGRGTSDHHVLWPKCVLFLQTLFETGSHVVQDGLKLTVNRDVLLTVPLPLRSVAVTGVNHYAVLYIFLTLYVLLKMILLIKCYLPGDASTSVMSKYVVS